MRIKDIMFPLNQMLSVGDSLGEALQMLAKSDETFLVLMDGQRLSGIILRTTIMDASIKGLEMESPAEIFQSLDFTCANLTTSLEKILTENYRYIVVLNQKQKPVGTFTKHAAWEKLLRDYIRLKEFNWELENIVETLHDGIGVTNGQGEIIRLNNSYERITGLTKLEAGLGRSLIDLEKEGVISESVALKVISQRQPVTIKQRIKTGVNVLVTGNPIYNEDGDIVRVIANFRDLTELEQLQKEVEHSRNLNVLLQAELDDYRAALLKNKVIAQSPAMKRILEMAVRIAPLDVTVLLTGPSGVGKEVVAGLIHNSSKRRDGPFLQVNCGAIPENLLESELFGYNPGAFTGANKEGKPGLFEIAGGGTILLDEIGDLPSNLQVKLLRILQSQEIIRLGATKPTNLNVRIIAATNKDLEKLAETGQFRKDLFYRLNVVPIEIPPLNERRADILPLMYKFLGQCNQKYGFNKRFSMGAITVLEDYHWPGNVREMENLVERLVITCVSDLIDQITVERALKGIQKGISEDGFIKLSDTIPLREATELVERELIERALVKYNNVRKAAKVLGVAHSSVVRKAEKYKIDRKKQS